MLSHKKIYLFIQQIFIEQLHCTWHCSGHYENSIADTLDCLPNFILHFFLVKHTSIFKAIMNPALFPLPAIDLGATV